MILLFLQVIKMVRLYPQNAILVMMTIQQSGIYFILKLYCCTSTSYLNKGMVMSDVFDITLMTN